MDENLLPGLSSFLRLLLHTTFADCLVRQPEHDFIFSHVLLLAVRRKFFY